MDSSNCDACELTRELTNLMVAIAASIERSRRRVAPTDSLQRELQAIDDAFAQPIALARKLFIAVYATHDCGEAGSPPP
jgi:hypothetical protein